MMDMMMKLGMILVAIALLVTMVSFAYSALKQPVVDDRFPSVNGTAIQLDLTLQKLCAKCLGKAVERDCYVIETNLTTAYSVNPYGLNLAPGAHTLKMKNIGGNCNVSVW